jgi:hypothetical protein
MVEKPPKLILDGVMRTSLRIAFCLAALLPARGALADDDNGLKVDVVVDMTEPGEKYPRPTPDHPVYFYPIIKGYTLGEGVIDGQKPLPPTPEVQHAFVKALAEQGYRVATRQSPPSLLLMFWWGYKTPIFIGESNGGLAANNPNNGLVGGAPGSGAGLAQALQNGVVPTNQLTNETEMEEIVFGANYEHNTNQYNANIKLESLNAQVRVPRYYVMVSALDFKEAMKKNYIVLWTARMSTPIYDHTLDQVFASLVDAGAPMFGRNTKGPEWPFLTVPVVPLGHVEVGTPYVKTYPSAPAAPPAAKQ